MNRIATQKRRSVFLMVISILFGLQPSLGQQKYHPKPLIITQDDYGVKTVVGWQGTPDPDLPEKTIWRNEEVGQL